GPIIAAPSVPGPIITAVSVPGPIIASRAPIAEARPGVTVAGAARPAADLTRARSPEPCAGPRAASRAPVVVAPRPVLGTILTPRPVTRAITVTEATTAVAEATLGTVTESAVTVAVSAVTKAATPAPVAVSLVPVAVTAVTIAVSTFATVA